MKDRTAIRAQCGRHGKVWQCVFIIVRLWVRNTVLVNWSPLDAHYVPLHARPHHILLLMCHEGRIRGDRQNKHHFLR